MNVNGITPRVIVPGALSDAASARPPGTAPAPGETTARPQGADPAAAEAGRAGQGAPSHGALEGLRGGTQAASGAAPAGVDPALWGVLSPDERTFYLRARRLGPLTYGPGRAVKPATPAVRGGRLDVKV